MHRISFPELKTYSEEDDRRVYARFSTFDKLVNPSKYAVKLQKREERLSLANIEDPGEVRKWSSSLTRKKKKRNFPSLVKRKPTEYLPLSTSVPRLPDLSEAVIKDLNLDPKMAEAIQLFNAGKAKAALEMLVKESLVEDTSTDLANFLYSSSYLDPVQVGEYLGSEFEKANLILAEYIRKLDIRNMDFDVALRKFLFCFKLPGEAQKIDRFMRQFAHYYFDTHPEDVPIIFKNELTVYVLSFGTIMLNTDVHNPGVTSKMTEKQFIDNIQYTQGGEDVPEDFLRDLYYRISSEEIKFLKDEVRFPDAVKKGWLWVYTKNGISTSWVQRWVVLCTEFLHILKQARSSTVICSIPLVNAVVTPVGKEKGKTFCLRLHIPPKTASEYQIRNILASENHLLMSAGSAPEISKWSRAIEGFCIQTTQRGNNKS